MFASALEIINYIFFALMGVSVILLIYKIFYHIYALMPARKFPEAKENHKFAILIPARNESAVIEGLLQSLKEQDYPKELFDTYVIIESKDDPTFEICKKYENVKAFVRPNLDIKRKGAALDQVLKHIIESGIAKEIGYEAYFIFDADNTINTNFLTEMNKSFDAGYEICLSYRNSKNWNDNWVASCSALTFSMLNTFQNKCRARFNENVLVSGTGFYISSRVINELGGWPFQSLTEDVEISNFAVLNNIKGAYNENTQHFDEQPTKLKISWNQRVRWCKGQLQVSRQYSSKLFRSSFSSKNNRWGRFEFGINVIPIAVPAASVIVYAFTNFIMGIVGVSTMVDAVLWQKAFINSAISFAGMYLFLAIYTLVLIAIEQKHIDLKPKNAFFAILLNPIFIFMYVPIFLTALFKKEIVWKPITRKADLKKDDADKTKTDSEIDDEKLEQV